MTLSDDEPFVPGWEAEGLALGKRFAQRVLEQAKAAGIQPPKSFLERMPKEWSKTLLLRKYTDLLWKHDPSEYVGKQRSIQRYIDEVIAPNMGWKRNQSLTGKDAPDRLNQSALFTLQVKPAYTPSARNFRPETHVADLQEILDVSRSSPLWMDTTIKDEVAPAKVERFGIHGVMNLGFIAAVGNVIAGIDHMPWTPLDKSGVPQTLPMPPASYIDAWPLVRADMKLRPGEYLTPSHMLVGSASAGGRYSSGNGVIRMNNTQGASGHPFIRMSPEQRAKLVGPGVKMSKANVARIELAKIQAHALRGQKWSGKWFRELMQPTTMFARGDAKVDYDLLVFLVALLEAGYPLGVMLLTCRGIALTSTVSWLMESIFSGPWTEALDERDVRVYDMRVRRFIKEIVNGAIQSTLAGLIDAVGGDVLRWDLNRPEGEAGIMAAQSANMFPPGKHRILFGAASRPALWTEAQVQELLATTPVGGSRTITVEVPNENGDKTHTEEVEVSLLEIDVRKMIVQSYQAVNGSGLAYAGYDLPTRTVRVPVPDEILTYGDANPEPRNWYIDVHGCTRSGSRTTSQDNSALNNTIVRAGWMSLLKYGPKSRLVKLRAKSVGLPLPRKIEGDPDGIYGVFRGDDSIIHIKKGNRIVGEDGKEYTPGQMFAVIMAMSGRYGNAAKQVFGTQEDPVLEFASVLYSKEFTGGLTPIDRSYERGTTTEGTASMVTRLPMSKEELGLTADDLGRVATTEAAKSRILPQRGSYSGLPALGNPTPGNEFFVEKVASMDEYGFTYGLEESDPSKLQELVNAEARRHAFKEGRKHGLSGEELKLIEDDYRESDLHVLLATLSRERGGKQRRDREPGIANDAFREKVESAKKGEYPYILS
jgi:hypothetical protein